VTKAWLKRGERDGGGDPDGCWEGVVEWEDRTWSDCGVEVGEQPVLLQVPRPAERTLPTGGGRRSCSLQGGVAGAGEVPGLELEGWEVWGWSMAEVAARARGARPPSPQGFARGERGAIHLLPQEVLQLTGSRSAPVDRFDLRSAFRVFSTCTPSLIQRQSSIQCIRLLKYADDSKHLVSAGASINS